MTTSLTMGAITGRDDLKNHAGDAAYIGMGAGIAGALTKDFFAKSIEAAILTRIDLLPTPLTYAATYPGDIVGVTLLGANTLICNGKKIPISGGRCEF